MPKFRAIPHVVNAVRIRAGEQDAELASFVAAGVVNYLEDGGVALETEEFSCLLNPGEWLVWYDGEDPIPVSGCIFAREFKPVEMVH